MATFTALGLQALVQQTKQTLVAVFTGATLARRAPDLVYAPNLPDDINL